MQPRIALFAGGGDKVLKISDLARCDAAFMPPWQEGFFDIHEIATGEGDAHFMVFPDGTTLLCDAGDRHGMKRSDGSKKDYPNFPDTTKRSGQWIADYILSFSQGLPHQDKVDYFWLTHFHPDHFGYSSAALPSEKGYGLSGITLVGERIHFETIVDRGWPSYDYPSKEFVERESLGFIRDYVLFTDWQHDNFGTTIERFRIGSTRQFVLKNRPEAYRNAFKVHNVAASGYIVRKHGFGKKQMSKEDPELFDENMFSCVAVFRYGKFSYYQGGDLPGSLYEGCPLSSRDFESQVADRIGPVTVVSADHHGCTDSSNPYFLWKLRPQVIIFNATDNNQPSGPTVSRCADPQWPGKPLLFITTQSSREQLGRLWNCFNAPDGHIVIRVYPGGDCYQIFVLNSHTGKYEIIYKSEVIEI